MDGFNGPIGSPINGGVEDPYPICNVPAPGKFRSNWNFHICIIYIYVGGKLIIVLLFVDDNPVSEETSESLALGEWMDCVNRPCDCRRVDYK